jgi:hypothetical protein
MRLRYICGDEQLQAEVAFSKNSLNIVYSNSGDPTLQIGNRELFKAIGYILDLVFKRNGVDISPSIIDEINATIFNLIFSGRANTFIVPIRADLTSLEFEAAYNSIETYITPNLLWSDSNSSGSRAVAFSEMMHENPVLGAEAMRSVPPMAST